MSRSQWLALCSCNVVIYAGIGGLVGLLPLYLTQLGADAGGTGFFLALIYLALAVSNLGSGWLAARLQRRKGLLMLGGLLAAPLAWGMSQAHTVNQLLLLMAGLWFVIGLPMTMISIFTGLAATAAKRGRSFGLLYLSAGIGLFTGGLLSGPLVDRWGFPTLFTCFAFGYLLIPLGGWFLQEQVVPPDNKSGGASLWGLFGNRTFGLLFVASSCAQAANIMIFLSRPLLMQARHFDATTISTANAIGSVVTLPLPLVVGWLADRIGRKGLLVACFLAPTLGLLMQINASVPWHFALSSMLSTVVGVSTVVGSALITDQFGKGALSPALASFNATPWIGIVLGLSSGGSAIRIFQMRPALLLALLLSLVGLLLLIPVADHKPGQRE